jgi:anthranilate phosphoribosyltransferase
LLGVFESAWVEPLARVLARLGSAHALVVHGDDGLDEISTTAATDVAELRAGEVRRFRLEPEALGVKRARLADLRVESAEESAAMIRGVLEGRTGPARDIVLLNAGAAIYAADRVPALEAGIAAAREALDSGRARATLERVIEDTQRGAPRA